MIPETPIHFLLRLLHYDAWANSEALHSIEAAGVAAPERVRKVMAHILSAEWLWLHRMGSGKPMAVWPDLSAAECRAELEELTAAWETFLRGQDTATLSADVEYVNSKGERWRNTRTDILTHVLMHSAYHRGQIASALRGAGAVPAYTDFIEAVRRRHCEP